ncbi:Uncharacterized protein conserved in bacteria [Mycobacteroides abscessus subsp. massiliense]|nr:Uncharacterized protein conserved in bacteria [Mycobacteroides abscessus subsp. massiliense]
MRVKSICSIIQHVNTRKYPVGVVEDQIYYFNEENIDNVIFEGYSDQDETRFQELFKEMMGNLDEDIKRETVQQKR